MKRITDMNEIYNILDNIEDVITYTNSDDITIFIYRMIDIVISDIPFEIRKYNNGHMDIVCKIHTFSVDDNGQIYRIECD